MGARSDTLIAAVRAEGDVAHYLRSDDDLTDKWTRALCALPALSKWRRVGRVPRKVCQACMSCAGTLGLHLDSSYEHNPKRARQVDAQTRTGDISTREVPVLVAKVRS